MNFLTAASKFRKDVEKHVQEFEEFSSYTTIELRERASRLYLEEFRRNCEVAVLLRDIAIDCGFSNDPNNILSRHFFISIRPPHNAIEFEVFKELCFKYLSKKMFLQWAITFEQKSIDGTGEGFHCHIIAKTKARSKGEILRNTTEFQGIVAQNCIDIKPCKNPVETFRNYCINYESDDGHKVTTREGDRIWRSNNNINDYYWSNTPLEGLEAILSSPEDGN